MVVIGGREGGQPAGVHSESSAELPHSSSTHKSTRTYINIHTHSLALTQTYVCRYQRDRNYILCNSDNHQQAFVSVFINSKHSSLN